MWIESNINFISNILKQLDLAKEFDNWIKLYNNFEAIINNENKEIKYIFNKDRNPEYIKEVNECYYISLASIRYSIISDKIKLAESTSDKDKVEIKLYCGILKEINTYHSAKFK
jgi:hypothetical protein